MRSKDGKSFDITQLNTWVCDDIGFIAPGGKRYEFRYGRTNDGNKYLRPAPGMTGIVLEDSLHCNPHLLCAKANADHRRLLRSAKDARLIADRAILYGIAEGIEHSSAAGTTREVQSGLQLLADIAAGHLVVQVESNARTR